MKHQRRFKPGVAENIDLYRLDNAFVLVPERNIVIV